MSNLFDFDKLQIVQKKLSIGQKYEIFNENNSLLFIAKQTKGFQIKFSIDIYNSANENKIFSIQQEKMMQLASSYIIYDENKNVLGKMKKKMISTLSTWLLLNNQGDEIVQIKADPKKLRFTQGRNINEFATFNFFIDKNIAGTLIRDKNIIDKYLLDLSADKDKIITRKLALCSAIILDFGEQR